MRLNIRIKILLMVVGLLSLGFGIVAFIFTDAYNDRLREDLQANAEDFATLATEPIGDTYLIYRDAGFSRIRQQIEVFTVNQPFVTNVSVSDFRGNILFQLVEDESLSITEASARSLEETIIKSDDNFVETIIQPYLEDSGARRFTIVYSIDASEIRSTIQSTVSNITAVSFVSIFVIIIATSVILDRLFIRSVQSLTSTALRIAAGEYDQSAKLELSRRDEIGELSTALVQMANNLRTTIDALEKLDDVKSEFMAIISHNLRTPITGIIGEVENAEYSEDSQELKHSLQSIEGSVKRLREISETALTISRLEIGQNPIGLEPMHIGPLLEKIYMDFTKRGDLEARKIDHTISQKQITVHVNKTLIKTAIQNILDNAREFTNEDGAITLTAEAGKTGYEIVISDNGIGIEEDELKHLFTKYHRVSDILEYNHTGMGLGLYTSKLIIERHGGSIAITSEVGVGTQVRIKLPLAHDTMGA